MIKLIAIDLDGTLVNSNRKISKKDIGSIKECQENGISISIVTGRSIRSVAEVTDMIGLKGLHLASSGSVVVDEKLNIYKALKVNKKVVRNFIETSREWKKAIVAHSIDGFIRYEKYYPKMDHIDEKKGLLKKVDDMLITDVLNSSLQLTVLVDENDPFDHYLKESFGRSVKIRRAGPFFLNILNIKAGKLFGLKEILKETSIKREELMVIGDTELDLGIIKYAGIGIAMGNASQNIKEAADFVTLDNDSDGVSNAIEKYVF